MRQRAQAEQAMVSAIFDGRPTRANQRPEPSDDREIMRESVFTGVSASEILIDLKACILVNKTECEFVTSDNPSVLTSRYYIQRLRSNNFGMGSSGAMLLLPLSPKYMALFYDGAVYTMPEKMGIGRGSLKNLTLGPSTNCNT